MRRCILMFLSTSSAFHGPVRLTARKNIPSIVRRAAQTATDSDTFWSARDDCWRPTVDDVERISWGKPAKKKGTGSRGVPHRLNQEERLLFDQARRKGFLEVPGSAWRSQRRDAPLINSYRSLCDARGQANIVLHKGNTGIDDLVVDLSPLRMPKDFAAIAEECIKHVNLEMPAIITQRDEAGGEEGGDDDNNDENPWKNRPLYQLPPLCISWELPRPQAKALGKELASIFKTVEKNGAKAKSKKSIGIKPGKGRRHGGYGIG